MTDFNALDRAARRRAIPGATEAEEQLLAMVTALTGELSITRERLDTLERLLENANLTAQAEIESFAPSEDAVAERESIRSRIISKVFRPLREVAERDLARAQQAQNTDLSEATQSQEQPSND